MTDSLEAKLGDLEARVRALTNLVLVNIVSTRDPDDALTELMLTGAERQAKAALAGSDRLAGYYLTRLVDELRAGLRG